MRYFKPTQSQVSSTPTTLENRYWPSAIDDNQIRVEKTPSQGKGRLPRQIAFSHASPIVQGINLVSTQELPDRFRSLFPFPLLNAVQSKCFSHVYQNDYNIVLSAPTGSGKTVIMELAICRLVSNLKDSLFKVIYQAPTRSLCAERFRDWSTKFTCLGLQCAELTGDTEYSQLRSIQTASIIITTPEKWDSMTRRWRDHMKLIQLVKLFLIDEVHVLNESRGAALEAVVSRMKSVASNVRFIALSATIPNSEDIATWLGNSDTLQHLPAHREHFGEEFRPTKLQKFVYGYQCNGNDFAFDRFCGSKLPEIISKHSNRKPIMIFCCTRNSSIATAKDLAKLWTNTIPHRRPWSTGSRIPTVKNPDLKAVVSSGVAFHHAGLESDDRHVIEKAFLQGQINIVCCTSTLAVGVNLPCYLVIIKNTVCWQEGGCREYSDLEMMQMLGRAGRPQFDDSAVAVILTKKERLSYYEKLVSGTEQLESCLHLNLIDHMNAEIGLGTIQGIESAIKWLAGTFLFVRLRRNPTHYKLKENADRRDEDEMLRQICEKDMKLLRECELVTADENLKSTAYGDAMAKYYVKFETMKILLSLPPRTKLSEILSAISQADEFRKIRLKASERSLYRELNRGAGTRYPIRVDLSQNAHKVSLLIQSELGAVDFPAAEQYQKHKFQFQQDKTMVFSHINRLLRCVVDCQIHNKDGIAVRNALSLSRSISVRAWEGSALQMRQIDQVGIVAVRKLASAGITSIQELEETEAHRIDMILSKNPPFGMKLLSRLADFPKLRVTVKMIGKATKQGESVRVNIKADIGFLNEKLPSFFQKRPIYVCCLVEISGGRLVDFRRMSAQKLQNGHEILLSADLTSALQHITCYVMCDDIGGTAQCAELKPDIPASLFSRDFLPEDPTKLTDKFRMNTSRRRSSDVSKTAKSSNKIDVFEDDDYADDDFLTADLNSHQLNPILTATNDLNYNRNSNPQSIRVKGDDLNDDDDHQPNVLVNGKFKCNHKCKDKSTCKHYCCREGLDKPPKVYKKGNSADIPQSQLTKTSQLSLMQSVRKNASTANKSYSIQNYGHDRSIDFLDLTQSDEPKQVDEITSSSKVIRMAKLDMAVSQPGTLKSDSSKLHVTLNSMGESKRPCYRREHSSSAYDDSGLEELFATPTALLDSDRRQSVDSYDTATIDPVFDETVDFFMSYRNQTTKVTNHNDDIGCSQEPFATQSRSQEGHPEIITKSSGFQNDLSSSSVFQVSNYFQPFASNNEATKRKGSTLDNASDNEAIKRPKHTLKETINMTTTKSDALPISSSGHEKQSEWNDIDQSLLEEFGDVVNFIGD
ncbi:Sec63 Brl domain-containing protein [Talaromyces proteolyticus]|uniref:DNA 3'-5' helicase n=1 Tax=Talaromyces proteolyticus TaxID=1131652 RepID=A0AAD4KWM0_9EURO|nr:Sec63 Brl domain-containing protein [Talaromyces proteolyticus]KAH8701665.1 Sec63 Brl domain-containing protein [Talaromyces proteolyticus]